MSFAEGEGASLPVQLHGSDIRFDCLPGQTLLAAAHAAGIDLPYECASGSCGSCRARLIAGRVHSRWPEAPGLGERDRAKGDRILCCQSVPLQACTLQVRPGADVAAPPPQRRPVRVAALQRLNEAVMHLVLEAADGRDFAFRPGQFMLFELGEGIGRRAYSMSNLPGSARLAFLVKRKPGGAAGRRLFEQLQAGDAFDVEGPYGRAWLRDPDDDGELLLLAGGSGLAPVFSIAQAALLRRPRRRVRLYFGCGSARELFWLPQMQQLAREAPGLELTVALMQASAGDPDGCRIGAVAGVLAADLPPRCESALYMAGPPGLVDHATALLVQSGRLRAERVFFDRYV